MANNEKILCKYLDAQRIFLTVIFVLDLMLIAILICCRSQLQKKCYEMLIVLSETKMLKKIHFVLPERYKNVECKDQKDQRDDRPAKLNEGNGLNVRLVRLSICYCKIFNSLNAIIVIGIAPSPICSTWPRSIEAYKATKKS